MKSLFLQWLQSIQTLRQQSSVKPWCSIHHALQFGWGFGVGVQCTFSSKQSFVCFCQKVKLFFLVVHRTFSQEVLGKCETCLNIRFWQQCFPMCFVLSYLFQKCPLVSDKKKKKTFWRSCNRGSLPLSNLPCQWSLNVSITSNCLCVISLVRLWLPIIVS